MNHITFRIVSSVHKDGMFANTLGATTAELMVSRLTNIATVTTKTKLMASRLTNIAVRFF